MAKDRTEVFESMPIGRAVLRQILPAIAAQMIVLLYNLADTFFVGRLNDPQQTAALMVVYSSVYIMTAIANLFGVGGASLIARLLGVKDRENARFTAAICFWWAAGSSIIFSIVYYFAAIPILKLCGGTEATLGIAREYNNWVIVIGGPFTVISMVLANLVRSEGRALGASIGASIGCVINVLLDPFFVLPRFLGRGAAGAGMATAISNFISAAFFVVFVIVKRKDTVVNFRLKYLKYTPKLLGKVLAVGVTSALQYALTVISISAQAKFVSKYSTEAVAALGIIKKLDSLPVDFTYGLSSGLLPLIAYNYSSGNTERRKSALRIGLMISFGFSLICLVCYEIFAPNLAGLFIKDSTTITLAAGFLRRMVIAMPLMALCYPLIIQFQAMGRVAEALVTSVLRKGALDVPLLFLMDSLIPLYGCMLVQPIVDGVTLVIAAALYFNFRRREKRSAPAPR